MSTSFWATLSAYCNELAPVTGPLLTSIAETAEAITRARTVSNTLVASSATVEDLLSSAE